MRSTTYFDKQDEAWISKIKDVLALPEKPNNLGIRAPKLQILSGNKGITNDIETVKWQSYKNTEEFKPKLDISSKDYLSVLKYALSTNLTYNKEKSRMFCRKEKVRAYGQL